MDANWCRSAVAKTSAWGAARGLALAAALAVSTTVLTAVEAQATPACTYAACNGKDPETTGCARDAVTKKELTASLIRGELRWSPSCHSFWTRISWSPQNGGLGQYPTIAGGVWDANGNRVRKAYFAKNPVTRHPDWTPMISQAYPWEQFCIYTATDDGCAYHA